jgi:eukaryotic-like serine/threonine-protein kinase
MNPEAERQFRRPMDVDPDTIFLAADAPASAAGIARATEAAPSLGQCLGGRYKIVELLAQGGMSRLYGARDERADQLVAIKEFQASAAQPADRWALVTAFMREANLLGDLQHPHIVRALDFIEEQGGYYIVMEWLGGRNLHRQLEAAPAGLPETQVLAWARQIGSALRYLHARCPPIIFCDLKPSNVFLLNNQQIKLVDFGIARYYFPEGDNETLRFGTPGFAAPEQYAAGRISPATDVFGLGRTLYCLLTGFNPAGQPAAQDFPPAESLRPGISATTLRALDGALQADPVRRLQSIDAFEAALEIDGPELDASRE